MNALKNHPWYDVAGPETAPLIIFIHGLSLNRKMWAPQVAALAGEYRVVAVDLPGHGALVDEPFSLETASRRVATAIEDVTSAQALIVGLSLGGFVTIDFGSRYPELAAGLVLAACTAEPHGTILLPYLLAGAIGSALPENVLSRLDTWLFRRMFGKVAEPVIQAGFSSRAMCSAISTVAGQDFRRKLHTYKGPVLILNGERDALCVRHQAAFVAAARHATAEIIAGASHVSNLAQPELFTGAVLRSFHRLGLR